MGVLTGSQLIKAATGEVHSISVAWKGAAVGDIVCYLIDDTADNGNPGNNKVVVVAATANGMWNKEWPQGKRFETGIFYKEGVVAEVYTELTAK